MRLWIIVKLDWEGAPPCVAEFQLLGDKLALGQTLPIPHEGHHRAKAHIRGIHRLVATGNGDYTSHIALAAVALGLGIANPNG